MTAVKLTPAEARRLGINQSPSRDDAGMDDGARRRRPGGQRRRRAPYHTVCADCGEHFTTQAAETRHLGTARHPHYQLVLELEVTADG